MNTLDERNFFEAQQGHVADVELLQQSNIAGIVFTHYMSTIQNTIRVFFLNILKQLRGVRVYFMK